LRYVRRNCLVGWVVLLLGIELGLVLVLGACSPRVRLMVVGSLLIGALLLSILVRPAIGILFIIPATALDFYGRLSATPEGTVTVFHLVLITTLISWLLSKSIRGRITLPWTTVGLPIVFFVSLVALSVLYTPVISMGIIFALKLVFLVSIVFLTVDLIKDKFMVGSAVYIVLLSVLGICLYAAYQIAAHGVRAIPGAAVEGALGMTRICGTFADPNKLAIFIVIGIIFLVSMLLERNLSRPRRTVLVLILGLFVVILLSTFSRSGLLAAAFGVTALLLMKRRSRFWLGAGALAGFFAFLFAQLSPFAGLVLFRIRSIANVFTDVSIRSRIFMSIAGLKMFLTRPFFGIGVRGFPVMFPEYMLNQSARELPDVIESHVLPITILTELGIVGLTVWVWFLVRVIKSGVRALREMHDEYLRNVEMALLAVFFAFMLDYMFYSDIMNNIFWLVIGLLFAIPVIDRRLTDKLGQLPGSRSLAKETE
jgi:hypothetical protein